MYKGLCVINMKGGVGKTTVAVNLGWEAAQRGLKTLVVDLDPQFNASVYLMGQRDYKRHISGGGLTVFDIFEEHTPMRDPSRPRPTRDNVVHSVRKYQNGSIDVLPSQLELAMTLKNPAGKAHLLSTFLSQHASDYDLTIIDPPPTDSMATEAAYLATNYVLVPVRPEFLSSIGFPLLGRSVRSFREQYPTRSLDVLGVFLSNVNAARGRREYESTKAAAQGFARSEGWRFLENEIRFSESYPNGSRAGTPIRNTANAKGYVREEFSNFAGEVFRLMGIGGSPPRGNNVVSKIWGEDEPAVVRARGNNVVSKIWGADDPEL